MKQIVCLYCEGSDTKIAVLSREKEGVKVHKVTSLTLSSAAKSHSKNDVIPDLDSNLAGELSFDSLEDNSPFGVEDSKTSEIGNLNKELSSFALSKMEFIPVITEPTVNFHLYEGQRNTNKKKLLEAVAKDIFNSKGITVDPDSVDVTELNDKTMLGVFIEGDIPCVNTVNLLANFNKRRYYKIPTIKTAELSLAHYVSQSIKFFPEDYTLIIYIGKEYSKLIFLEGQKLKHIGSTLDIGTKNLHTYDVYFSKILLEMENGGIPKLDNIILCGEDRSENLVLSFYGTFPEANVSELKFENMDVSSLDEETVSNLALFAVPISVGAEYFDELEKKHVGINFLPKYVQENQKVFQFAWHGYALLPLIFVAAFYFTFHILSNIRQIRDMDFEIERLNQRQLENQALVDQITPLDNRINSFDNTKAILDSAAVGSGIWNGTLNHISDFAERRRNFWISHLQTVGPEEVKINGYSLSRTVLTEFVKDNNAALLKNILYEPLREKSAFSYVINFKLQNDSTMADGK